MYYDVKKELGLIKLNPYSSKTWLYEVKDPQTGFSCLVRYNQRRFTVFNMKHPFIIKGTAVYYKDKLKSANIIFVEYQHKFWFGELMERLLKILIFRTKRNIQSFEKLEARNYEARLNDV